MDIKKYLKDYQWVLIFALLVALAAGFWAWRGDKYSASLTLTVSRLEAQKTADYQYDNYYALKASDEFGSAVVGWFKTPEMAQIIYQKANLALAEPSLGGLSRAFKAAKISPTTVEVRFGGASESEVKIISQAVVDAAAEKTEALKAFSGSGVNVAFSVKGGEPVIINNSNDLWQKTLLGLVVGLIFGLFVKIAGEYFR